MMKNFAKAHEETILNIIRDLCRIPAPSHDEGRRAEYCKAYFESFGAEGVYIDEVKNVIFPLNCEGSDEITVIAAHTDTVFPDTVSYPEFHEDDERIYCPGVGDDTASVAALMLTAKYFVENKISPRGGILFVCNSCEEGLGNLKGSKQIMKDFEGRIKEFYTFDGKYPGLVDRCVGSHRYEVICETEGGHSYGAFGNNNAIAELAKLITKLDEVKVPVKENTKTTYNVGSIEGGTSVNTIAQQAKMLYEYRSDDAECVELMKNTFEKLVAEANAEGKGKFTVSVVGIRPCSNDYDKALHQQMIERVKTISEKYTGLPCPSHSGSTDCNAPMAVGVPAVCVGTYKGFGTHTREEYVLRESFPISIKITLELMLEYFK